MPAPITIYSSFKEGCSPGWTLAQVVDKHKALILVANVLSVSLNVYIHDDASRTLIYGPVALTIATTVYDTLQDAGGIWTEDNLGCNFKNYLAAADVFGVTAAEGGKTYLAEYRITMTTANGTGIIPVDHVLACRGSYQT